MTPASTSHLNLGSGTHPGETGKNNEDSFAVQFFRAANGEPATLAVVCDGVGGYRAGEVASALAVKAIVESVAACQDDQYLAAFTNGVNSATQQLTKESEVNDDLKGMGTTCAIALIVGRRLYTGYVGDSRLFLLRPSGLRQISVDHTWLQAAIEYGLLTPEEALTHPNQHVLLRHLGTRGESKADIRLKLADDETPDQSEQNQGLTLDVGDTVLVCSDGLSDLVKAPDLEQVLTAAEPPAAVDRLILMARQRGGHDNITVVVMRVIA